MGAAAALGERGRGRTAPNPNVGCVIVKDPERVTVTPAALAREPALRSASAAAPSA